MYDEHAPEGGGQAPSRGLQEAVLVAILYAGYSISRHFASADLRPAIGRAHAIQRFEELFHLNVERAATHLAVAVPVVGLMACYWYSAAHYIVTPIVLVWLYRRRPEVYRSARNALVAATALGLVLYLLLPTAPPRMLPGFTDVLAAHASAGWWGGDASAPRGLGGLTNQLAAFPSLHAGWSLWVALAVRAATRRRSPRLAGWFYAGGTAFVVIVTGNHWVVDVLCGWVVVLAGWWAFAPRRVAPLRQVGECGGADGPAQRSADPFVGVSRSTSAGCVSNASNGRGPSFDVDRSRSCTARRARADS